MKQLSLPHFSNTEIAQKNAISGFNVILMGLRKLAVHNTIVNFHMNIVYRRKIKNRKKIIIKVQIEA